MSENQFKIGMDDDDKEPRDIYVAVESFLSFVGDEFGDLTIEEVTFALLAGVAKINCAFGISRDEVNAQLVLSYEKMKRVMIGEGTFGAMTKGTLVDAVGRN